MNSIALITLGLAIAVVAVAAGFRNWRLVAVAATAALVVAIWTFVVPARRRPAPEESVSRATAATDAVWLAEHTPAEEPADGYVSSRECVECHSHQHDTWHASYHRTMTQPASPDTIVGDFSGRTLVLDGVAYTPFREGDDFRMRIESPARASRPAQSVEHPIVLATGSHHMQIYWTPTGQGRTLGELPLYYLKEGQAWLPRDGSFLTPRAPHDRNVDAGRWNRECIQCHVTHGRPRPRMVAGEMGADSLAAQFGIACEACHGPGTAHVQARRGEAVVDAIVNPARLSSQKSAQVCGRCHGVSVPSQQADLMEFHEHGHPFRPGAELSDAVHIVRRDRLSRDRFKAGILPDDETIDRAFDSQFWRDGMVRVSGREFNGLLESACYQKGKLSCISCHALHQPASDSRPRSAWADDQLTAEALGGGDAACTQCHSASQFAAPTHTHHAETSAGSRCFNCHMPHTTYGLLKAIRSHTIDRPGVKASVEAGRPNACNLCHLDQSLAWTAGHLKDWYGIPSPELSDDETNVSAMVLWSLRGDAGQRALAAWHLGWQPARQASGDVWIAPHLINLLDDPYLAVRHIARRSLRTLPAFESFECDVLDDSRLVDAKRQALDAWHADVAPRLKRSATKKPAQVLISPNGTLDEVAVQRLKQDRDDRPVSLAE